MGFFDGVRNPVDEYLIDCVAPGDTCVLALCRGRHRVQNRVGEVQARDGVGWGGVVTYFANRIVPQHKSWSLAPRIQCLSVCLSGNHFTAVLSKLHMRIESAR